ncbi:LOW QUALITY PROTEIN: kinase suppressor of Ras 2 [Nilaparvata lugens]|uniref:LOW QUALITY PROTEIN: kinase suppressor of Ras 2 n=1 Tax=Nilaparvata lugens TaxID=108931 RepID=UPI00193E404D|nr:LOW QUALITY PROTEIN: kinase suppressor of Ras 2 [Nilaparvata lugens]
MADVHEQAEVKNLYVNQKMIDVSADRLDGLRTQCATSAELTQQEIRTLEGKLIKLFSYQLVAKSKIADMFFHRRMKLLPSIHQWLMVVGLGKEAIQSVCSRVLTVEALQEKSEHELRTMIAREEELKRLCRALHNLKRYTDILLRGDIDSEIPLYWDSWDRRSGGGGGGSGASPRPGRSRATRGSVPSDDAAPLSPPLPTPPPTPPLQKTAKAGVAPPLPTDRLTRETCPQHNGRTGANKFPTTPPPRKKHTTGLQPLADAQPLTKSKSHESQLANKVDGETTTAGPERRQRLPTEPGPGGQISPLLSSPIRSPPPTDSPHPHDEAASKRKNSYSLQVPKSPRTPTAPPRGMGHTIAHRFTKTFKMMTTCNLCDKQMFIGTGLKCKECKYKCHRDCEAKVPPSCGLPKEFIEEFRKAVQIDGHVPNQSPTIPRPSPSHLPSAMLRKEARRQVHVPPFPGGPDSSSNTSSCNSSTPSSPALVLGSTTPHPLPDTVEARFEFPDVVTHEQHPLERSQDSDRTVSVSGSDSDRTPVRVDSQDSQVSDGDPADRPWPRQNSLSLREWDIPFDELKIGESIGTGHFGTVYRGNWHGDVAVKLLNMNYLDDEKTLEAFKLEVATFRKTRHENLVLFMGACMKPPRLAIVTSMCKGMTLYTHIHLCKDKFNMNKTTIVAQQISQGMGYLHARGIVHKDLKTKNIFLENGKVVITDFGLFSVTKLCYGNRMGDGLSIPPGWLCYLAPEIIRSLRAHQKPNDDELPFSKMSDVYAFGTVWYELLCGEWPFKSQPPESIIWQVGKGMKQTLANLQASRDVKDILMLCWSFRAGERPDFVQLLKTLEKLPKKRLARSPSHPIHLSRSAESVF